MTQVYYPIEGDTLPIPFNTFGSANESITLTGLAVTDIEIYKDGGVTQRASDNGYTLLDTDGIDFDGLTGIHGFSIDLSDNSDAGFYAVGPWYTVVVSAITVDAQTVSFVAAQFRIASATVGLAGTNLDAAVTTRATPAQVATELATYDGPTNTEMEARTLAAASYATAANQTNIEAKVDTVDTVADAIKVIADALGATGAARLALSAGSILPGTVDSTGFAPTTTEFEADDITEATASHFNGRVIIFTSGVLQYQACSISAYALATGRGHFTVSALTEAPGNNDTFIIV